MKELGETTPDQQGGLLTGKGVSINVPPPAPLVSISKIYQ